MTDFLWVFSFWNLQYLKILNGSNSVFLFLFFFSFEHFNLPIFGALLNLIFELRRIIVIPSPRDGA